MLLENLQVVMAILVIVGIVAFVFYWKVVPGLVNRDARMLGVKTREQYAEHIQSDNRWHNMLRTGGLYAMGGGLLFLVFFTIILAQLGTDISANWWYLIIGTAGCFVYLGSRILYRVFTWGQRYIPVAMTISINPDGRKPTLKEALLTEVEEIGHFKKTEREAYFGNMSIQFCEAFSTKLFKGNGDPKDIDWDNLKYKDLKWRPDEPDKITDETPWTVQNFDWDGFCEKECPKDQCSFSRTRKDVLADDQWLMYEVRGRQFEPFEKWVYIMPSDLERAFTRDDMQFAIGGVIWPVSGARISATLIEVNHTIDGKHRSGKPELIPCPILLVTESSYTRKLTHQGISAEHMTQTQLYKALKHRPIPGSLNAAIHVRKVDAQNQQILDIKVSDRNKMRAYAENIIEQLMLAGKKFQELSKNPFALIILATVLIISALVVIMVITGKIGGGTPNGDEVITTTQAIMGMFKWLMYKRL